MSHYQALADQEMSGSRAAGGRTMGYNAELAEMIQNLQRKTNQLERAAAKLGTPSETRETRDRVNEMREDGKKLCEQIIALIKEQNHKATDREVLKRLSGEFQGALEKFTKVNRQIEETEQQIVRRMSHGAGAAGAAPGPASSSSRNQMSAQEMEIDTQLQQWDVEALQKRTEGIQQIERDVTELNEMFRDLKLLVDQQQESLDTIEANVTEARTEVEAGQQQLIEAEELQKKARKRQCCILFLVLAVLAAIIIAVIFVAKK